MTNAPSNRPEWATVSRYVDFQRHLASAEHAIQNARTRSHTGTEAPDHAKTLDAINNAHAALDAARIALNMLDEHHRTTAASATSSPGALAADGEDAAPWADLAGRSSGRYRLSN